MSKWGWLKPVGKVAKEAGKVAAQAGLQAAVSSNPGIALAVQVAQASIGPDHVSIESQVAALNSILFPHGFVVVRATPQAVQ